MVQIDEEFFVTTDPLNWVLKSKRPPVYNDSTLRSMKAKGIDPKEEDVVTTHGYHSKLAGAFNQYMEIKLKEAQENKTLTIHDMVKALQELKEEIHQKLEGEL